MCSKKKIKEEEEKNPVDPSCFPNCTSRFFTGYQLVPLERPRVLHSLCGDENEAVQFPQHQQQEEAVCPCIDESPRSSPESWINGVRMLSFCYSRASLTGAAGWDVTAAGQR